MTKVGEGVDLPTRDDAPKGLFHEPATAAPTRSTGPDRRPMFRRLFADKRRYPRDRYGFLDTGHPLTHKQTSDLLRCAIWEAFSGHDAEPQAIANACADALIVARPEAFQ